ncbi:MAG: hypothetical protein KGJ13_03640 [Patescibacteria group bacterium]|nr:hypothetical protein [Patescibacteria group bacterium]MDE2019415.1 hypothetical protein [Patescibacteria group bacterium]
MKQKSKANSKNISAPTLKIHDLPIIGVPQRAPETSEEIEKMLDDMDRQRARRTTIRFIPKNINEDEENHFYHDIY